MTEPYASHDASEIEHKTANESCHLELYVISHQILNTMPNVLHTNLLSEGRFFSCVFDTLMCTTLVGPTLGPRPPVMSLFFMVVCVCTRFLLLYLHLFFMVVCVCTCFLWLYVFALVPSGTILPDSCSSSNSRATISRCECVCVWV